MINIFKTFHELNNGEKLKNMLPHSIFYTMCHFFAEKNIGNDTITVNGQKQQKIVIKKNLNNSIFGREVKQQPFTDLVFDTNFYQEQLPQNQVLLHGIIYKALLNTYLSHFKKPFDNVLLSDFQNKDTHISYETYKNLPKKYRGIFVRYDTNSYILNTPTKNMFFAFNKKNKKTLEELLLRAQKLIPVIYKENKEDSTAPAFVKESSAAKRVSDEQLRTIQELQDIFTQISKITFPVISQKDTGKNTNAQDIYNEYLDMQNRKSIFYTAYNYLKSAKQLKESTISKAQKEFDLIKYKAERAYKELHQNTAKILQRKTSVKIR